MKRFVLPAALLLGAAACQDRVPTELTGPPEAPALHGDGEHSHGRYLHISWVPRPDIGELAVEFTYQAGWRRGYRACWRWTGTGATGFASTPCTGEGGFAGPGDIIRETIGGTTFEFGDGARTGTLHFLVTSAHPSPIALENWIFVVALDPSDGTPNLVHEYAGPGPFVARSRDCCRVGGLRNSGSTYGVQTRVRPGAAEPSPLSHVPPIVNVVRGGTQTWAVPATSPSGRPLRWSLTSPAAAGIGGVQPPGLSIDAATGIKSWETDPRPLGYYWTNVTIEELDNGEVVGMVQVDYLIHLVATPPENRPPLFTAPAFCAGTVSATVGELLSFAVTAMDPDAADVVTLAASGVPAGATFTPPAPANPVSATFSWTPPTAGPRLVTFSATDPHGAQALCPVTINVETSEPPPPPPPPPPTCDGADVVVPLNRVWSTGTADGTIRLVSRDLFAQVHDILAFLPRPQARAEDVRRGATWEVGTPAREFAVADFTGDTRRDVRVTFRIGDLIDGGNLSAATTAISIWGRDRITGELFCGVAPVTVVP